jgi:hypothetical protein
VTLLASKMRVLAHKPEGIGGTPGGGQFEPAVARKTT